MYLTYCNLLIAARFMARSYEILPIIFLKEFIKLNVNSDIKIKNLKHVELKSDSHLPKKIVLFVLFVIWVGESFLKIMKNAFYFMLKALFVLKIFKLLS